MTICSPGPRRSAIHSSGTYLGHASRAFLSENGGREWGKLIYPFVSETQLDLFVLFLRDSLTHFFTSPSVSLQGPSLIVLFALLVSKSPRYLNSKFERIYYLVSATSRIDKSRTDTSVVCLTKRLQVLISFSKFTHFGNSSSNHGRNKWLLFCAAGIILIILSPKDSHFGCKH
jgi:hypothetical protein